MIRDQLEVQKQIAIHAREKKFQNPFTHRHLEVERAINKAKIARAAVVEFFDFGHERIQLERPRGFVQRRQTKFAFERAAARGLDIDKALGDVFVGVVRVRQRQLRQGRLFSRDHFVSSTIFRDLAAHDVSRQLRKSHIAPTGNHMIRQRANALLAGFVTDFRPAEHHGDVRRNLFEQRHHPRTFVYVPDIHADADDARV